jgi:hypothetical protein
MDGISNKLDDGVPSDWIEKQVFLGRAGVG